jgi:hypothetical protein
MNQPAEALATMRQAANTKRPGEGDRSCLLLRANIDILARYVANTSLPVPALTLSSRIIP